MPTFNCTAPRVAAVAYRGGQRKFQSWTCEFMGECSNTVTTGFGRFYSINNFIEIDLVRQSMLFRDLECRVAIADIGHIAK